MAYILIAYLLAYYDRNPAALSARFADQAACEAAATAFRGMPNAEHSSVRRFAICVPEGSR